MFKGTIWPKKYVIESVEYYKMEPFVCWMFCEVNQWIQKYTWLNLKTKLSEGYFPTPLGANFSNPLFGLRSLSNLCRETLSENEF